MASRTKEREKHQIQFISTPIYSKDKEKPPYTRFVCISTLSKKSLTVTSLLVLLFTFLYLFLSPTSFQSPYSIGLTQTQANSTCDGIAPFYIYDLPARFTTDLVDRCQFLNIYVDTCPHVVNQGLGQPVTSKLGPSWYGTNEFLSDMLFHARAKKHPCRVHDIDAAKLFYVPFYAGLYASFAFREGNHTLRDQLAVELVSYLSNKPTFRKHGGRDHFLVVGRTSWDFMRISDPNIADFGANRLLYLPELADVAVLTIERHPWEGKNQFGIPYPSYFHPKTADEVVRWQNKVLGSKRPYLYAFVGGARVASEKAAVRAEIINKCSASKQCAQVTCKTGTIGCYDPTKVLATLRGAQFCLQPPGLSFTRRSTFDSILAGCIPVFFSEHSAYTQYEWYIPNEARNWSVLLDQKKAEQIEEELGKIPLKEVESMRKEVVRMIPQVTYAHPDSTIPGFRDAVDIALVQLTERVGRALEQEQTAVRVD
ncbi:Xyloglucan galactosyltransferase KATAMARI1 [Rhynchospora pubera]|uniref:Xyloglucan galactosyltransferase KATAMARI1 n=1 Tax=Rhynchospora pubera TaxID=906938 RepID=A0AAV8G146_9POAL|nr:Xyloglucan galactosyltransferase KATAMARI1 [Rhynchospora pubera]